MKKFVLFLALLASAALGFFLKALIENEVILELLRDYGTWIVVFALSGLVVIGLTLIFGYLIIRGLIRKFYEGEASMTEADMVKGLFDLLTTPEGLTNPTPKDRQRAAVANFGTWIIRRETTQFYFGVTVTVIGGLIGTATLFLLYEQNQKIDEQNRRITIQTDANVSQSVLLEASRRTSDVQELNNLLFDISSAAESTSECAELGDTNCWRWYDEKKGILRRILSDSLQLRIEDFARRSTPYFTVRPKYETVEFDERLKSQIDLAFKSPERGVLISKLMRNSFQVDNIDFTHAELRGTVQNNAYLANVNLNSAELSDVAMPGAILNNADLNNSDLTKSRFNNSYGPKAEFNSATLVNSNFNNAVLTEADMSDGILQNISLNNAMLIDVSFENSNMKNADLRRANLMGAKLIRADLTNASFGYAHISGADFTESIQTDLNLITAWTWDDALPKGLLPGSQYKTCRFNRDWDRTKKPADEACSDTKISASPE